MRGVWFWIWFVLWVASYVGTRIYLESADAEAGLRLMVAAAPLVPFLGCMIAFIAMLRAADELHRRVQLEALAIAFPLSVAFFMALGLAELAVDLPKEDFSYRHSWFALPLSYFIGFAISMRRYQ